MDKVPREITKKESMAELPFLHSARQLMLIDIFVYTSLNIAWMFFYVSWPWRGETFLHSERRLMLSDICIKFREYSLNGC